MGWKPTICLLLALAGISARAEDGSRTKIGFDFRALRTLSQPEVGWLAGAKYGWFIGRSDAYVGIGGHFGSPTGGNPSEERLFYVGGSIGYDGKFSRTAVYELALFAGYGQGKILSTEETSYYVAEPSFGAGFALGLGWRILFTGSYLHMSRTNQLSGVTLGIRLDRRYDTKTRSVDP